MRPLYEISIEYLKFLDSLEASFDDPSSVPEALVKKFDDLADEREKKIGNTARAIKNLLCEAEGIEKERKALQKRERAAYKKAEWLKDYLSYWLEPGEEYEDSAIRLSWRKGSSIEVDDELLVPDQYCSFERKVSKDLIEKDLKLGANLSFARLIHKQHLQVK